MNILHCNDFYENDAGSVKLTGEIYQHYGPMSYNPGIFSVDFVVIGEPYTPCVYKGKNPGEAADHFMQCKKILEMIKKERAEYAEKSGNRYL